MSLVNRYGVIGFGAQGIVVDTAPHAEAFPIVWRGPYALAVERAATCEAFDRARRAQDFEADVIGRELGRALVERDR